MATEKELSSTEKLLKIIRSSDNGQEVSSADSADSGFSKRIKRGWIPSVSRDLVGVEIFRDTLNLVRMTKARNTWKAVFAASVSIPEGLSIDHADFPKFLKYHLQSADIKQKTDIWACLPPSRGETWNVFVPKVKKGLTNAVYWSARKEKTFDENEYYFDYRIKEETNDKGIQKLSAEVCIASARDINLYKKIFSETGYPLKGITLPAYALENLFEHKWIDPGDDAYAVLYIGEDSSYIEIHGRHTTLFSRVIKTGRDSILDSVSMESKRQSPAQESSMESDGDSPEIPPEEQDLTGRQQAAQILKQQGGDLSDENLFDMIRPALERLARQLERTIDHCVNVLNNPAPARIYICGGISFLPGLQDFFSEQLGIPAELLDIPEQESESGKIFPDSDQRLSLVSTAALAMPSVQTINFLHTAIDKDREKKALRNTNFVAALCALLFVLTACWWWSARHELEQTRTETAELEQQLEQYLPRLRAEDLATLAGELKGNRNRLRRYSRKLYPAAVLKEINQLTPGSVSLLTVRIGKETGGKDSGRKNTPALMVEGFINSDPSLYETNLTGYLLQLRRSPLFSDTTIVKSTPETLSNGDNVYSFTLNIDLEQV
ncbi:MAG: hypothetical protein K9J85_10345 [Desulfobacteraceae bacterium]|nr:hypothetical protein [Desulfobacteraceae bacterium]